MFFKFNPLFLELTFQIIYQFPEFPLVRIPPLAKNLASSPMSPHCFDHFTQIAPLPTIRLHLGNPNAPDQGQHEGKRRWRNLWNLFLNWWPKDKSFHSSGQGWNPNTVGETICNVQLIAKCIYKALSILAWFDRYYPMYNNPSSKISPKKPHEELFGKKSHHTWEGRHHGKCIHKMYQIINICK